MMRCVPTIRSALRVAAASAALLLPACVSDAAADDRGPLRGARRLLALDYGTRSGRPRIAALRSLPTALDHELRRPSAWITDLGGLRTPGRARSAADGLLSGVRHELDRRPTATRALTLDVYDLEEDLADDLDLGLRLLGPGNRPLDELSDRVHRTDRRDVGPEATLWQRLRRRLGL
jgi:hypothetical protein